MRSMVSGVIKDSRRLAPAMIMYLAFSTSKEGTVPKVREYARFTEARQSVGWRTMLGEPKARPRFLKNTSWKLSVEDQRVPCGPYCCLTAESFFAAKSQASSQLAGRHFPSPLSPTRISGFLMRERS